MNILFLDDNPARTRTFRSQVPAAKCVATTEECIAAIQERPGWDIVFLDHDLGGEQFVDSRRADTGMGVVRWICENKPNIGFVLVHSANPDGAMRMKDSLVACGYVSCWLSFVHLMPVLDRVIDEILGEDHVV